MHRINYTRVELMLVVAIIGLLAAAMLHTGSGWVDLGAGLVMANAGGGLELKQIEDLVQKATEKVKATTDRMQQALDQALAETKRLETVTGKTNDELKTAHELAAASQKGLKEAMDRLLEVEQKLSKRAPGGSETAKSWGEIVAASEQYKAAKGKADMSPVEVGSFHKTAILSSDVTSAAGTVNYLAQAQRAPFVAGTERQLIVRNLLPVYQTEAPLVEFARENVFTNSAAPQAASSPNATDGQTKAESALTFTFVQSPMVTIAHWIPASRQILADAKMLGSYIDQRLRYGVLLEEEDEVLNSTGANGELNGLCNQATGYNRRATADSRLDTVLKAFLQVTLSDYAADGIVMSWVDWTEIMLLKDTQGRYLFGNPQDQSAPRLWGRPVVPTNTLTVGKFLTGAFQLAAALWDRELATVRISEHHDKFFIQNMVALLAEERVTLTVFRPAALVYGDFGAAAGQPG